MQSILSIATVFAYFIIWIYAILAYTVNLMLSELNKDRVDSKKPRKEGLTFIVDRLQVLDKENFEALSGYIDVVKIYNVIPIIIPETVLEKRIKFYHIF